VVVVVLVLVLVVCVMVVGMCRVQCIYNPLLQILGSCVMYEGYDQFCGVPSFLLRQHVQTHAVLDWPE
jgi:hypothetical protein